MHADHNRTAPLTISDVSYRIKGDFKGLVFTKFGSQTERDRAVEILHKSSAGSKEVWARPDFPLDKRIVRGIAFGTKYIMSKWGLARSELNVDWGPASNVGKVSLSGGLVLKVFFANGVLLVEYGPEWEKYMITDEHPEFRDMLPENREKATKGGGKGKSKGGAVARH